MITVGFHRHWIKDGYWIHKQPGKQGFQDIGYLLPTTDFLFVDETKLATHIAIGNRTRWKTA